MHVNLTEDDLDFTTRSYRTIYPQPGKTVLLSRYRLLSVAGCGAMGMVFKALDLTETQTAGQSVYCAIKIINPELLSCRPDILERVRNEAIIFRNLRHENIMAIHGFAEDQGWYFLIMEWLQGKTFRELMHANQSKKRKGVYQILAEIEPVVDALKYIHDKGIVHCDIKPDNIFRCDSGRVVLTDFGIAHNCVHDIFGEQTNQNVQEKEHFGSLPYLPPQARVEAYQPGYGDDIYALAVTIYELLSGELPFKGYMLTNRSLAQEQLLVKPHQAMNDEQWAVLRRALSADEDKRQFISVRDFYLQLIHSIQAKTLFRKLLQEKRLLISFVFVFLVMLVLFFTFENNTEQIDEQKQIEESSVAKPTTKEQQSKDETTIEQAEIREEPVQYLLSETVADYTPYSIVVDLSAPEKMIRLLARHFFYNRPESGVWDDTVRLLEDVGEDSGRKGEVEKNSRQTETPDEVSSAKLQEKRPKKGIDVVNGWKTVENKSEQMVFITIEPGCFILGDASKGQTFSTRRICVEEIFAMGRYEVTQGVWERVMGNNPAFRKKGGEHPIENVSWTLVQQFIEKLNKKTGLKFRLPTEAEWVYACQLGGLGSGYCTPDLDAGALYNRVWRYGHTKVALRKPNNIGLYDMNGNVMEWISEPLKFLADKRAEETETSHNDKKVIRGGHWARKKDDMQANARWFQHKDEPSGYIGFRLVLELPADFERITGLKQPASACRYWDIWCHLRSR